MNNNHKHVYECFAFKDSESVNKKPLLSSGNILPPNESAAFIIILPFIPQSILSSYFINFTTDRD